MLANYYASPENRKVTVEPLPGTIAHQRHIPSVDAVAHNSYDGENRPTVVPHACHKPGSVVVNNGHS